MISNFLNVIFKMSLVEQNRVLKYTHTHTHTHTCGPLIYGKGGLTEE